MLSDAAGWQCRLSGLHMHTVVIIMSDQSCDALTRTTVVQGCLIWYSGLRLLTYWYHPAIVQVPIYACCLDMRY